MVGETLRRDSCRHADHAVNLTFAFVIHPSSPSAGVCILAMPFDAENPNALRGDTVDSYPGGNKVGAPRLEPSLLESCLCFHACMPCIPCKSSPCHQPGPRITPNLHCYFLSTAQHASLSISISLIPVEGGGPVQVVGRSRRSRHCQVGGGTGQGEQKRG